MRLSKQIDWNDLRLLLTIAETGQVNATASSLGIDPTTVTRRLRKLEKDTQVKLVERIRGGVVLSDACKDLIDSARYLDRALDDIANNLSEKQPISGVIRITMFEYMAVLLAPTLADLQREYPGLTFDIRESYYTHSVEGKEADIAIRGGDSPSDSLVGTRHVFKVSIWGLPHFVEQNGRWPWVSWNIPHINADNWIDEHDPGGKIVMRVSSLVSQSQMLLSGAGVALIPDIWVKNRPELSNLVRIKEAGELTNWVLTTEELRALPKIQICLNAIRDYIRAHM